MSNSFIPEPNQLSSKRILVVGDVMLDRYWFGMVSRISPEAPVPVVRVSNEQERVGGAANVALNVKSLGGQVTLLAMVGEDDGASRLERLLAGHGVRSCLRRHPDVKTIVKLRVVGRSQQMLRVDFEETPDPALLLSLMDDFEHLVREHDVVVFSDYDKGGLAHVAQMIAMARAAGKLILVDPKGQAFDRYAGATVMTPNRSELESMVGHCQTEAELHSKAEGLRLRLQLQAMLLTRSEEGMSLFESGKVSHVPALAREVADVTGAGDTVIGTMALMLACGLSFEDAMRHANRAGGLVVEKFGTATVTYEELFA